MVVLRESDFSWPTEAELRRANMADLRKLSKQTGAPLLAELEQAKAAAQPKTTLARGVSTQDAPGCAASLRKKREAERAARKSGMEKRAAKKQAKRAAAASPKPDDTRKIKVLNKDFAFGREGTARNKAWLACKASKSVAEYASKGGALRYLPRWVKAGAIELVGK